MLGMQRAIRAHPVHGKGTSHLILFALSDYDLFQARLVDIGHSAKEGPP